MLTFLDSLHTVHTCIDFVHHCHDGALHNAVIIDNIL